jgi:hypothetical protein
MGPDLRAMFEPRRSEQTRHRPLKCEPLPCFLPGPHSQCHIHVSLAGETARQADPNEPRCEEAIDRQGGHSEDRALAHDPRDTARRKLSDGRDGPNKSLLGGFVEQKPGLIDGIQRFLKGDALPTKSHRWCGSQHLSIQS